MQSERHYSLLNQTIREATEDNLQRSLLQIREQTLEEVLKLHILTLSLTQSLKNIKKAIYRQIIYLSLVNQMKYL